MKFTPNRWWRMKMTAFRCLCIFMRCCGNTKKKKRSALEFLSPGKSFWWWRKGFCLLIFAMTQARYYTTSMMNQRWCEQAEKNKYMKSCISVMLALIYGTLVLCLIQSKYTKREKEKKPSRFEFALSPFFIIFMQKHPTHPWVNKNEK